MLHLSEYFIHEHFCTIMMKWMSSVHNMFNTTSHDVYLQRKDAGICSTHHTKADAFCHQQAQHYECPSFVGHRICHLRMAASRLNS
jgi:hypothetical protein